MPQRRSGWRSLVCAAGLWAAGAAAPAQAQSQQMSGSLESGLQSLAQALLAGLPAAQRPALSVMPFPGADQSCPVLSVFVVDELTTTMIGAVQPRPRLVERQQLETIVAQNRLNEFMTDPEQRRRVGGLLGIGALVVGTYAVIGDRVRVNARLVEIDTGETVAAAAVSIPRTGELTELLRQDSRRGPNCLSEAVGRAPASAAALGAGASAAPRPALSPGEPCEEQESLRACVRSLRRNGQEVQLLLEIENITESAVALAAVGPAPSLLDNDGGVYAAKQVTGVPVCGRTLESVLMHPNNQHGCLISSGYLPRATFRPLPPGARAILSMQLKSDDASKGDTFTLSAALAVLSRLPTGMSAQEAERQQARLILLTLPELRPRL
ncbi:FlgO family outer membrane protein [Paracraurococcus lichenis]|uniref:FlgO family outer membrane protein n=1 Tax=Paracraurococcus lichenis TaxID=3064888 RepID=A0ABT9E055_9PROT|nr:FlgO family outer membrane protein [Paracraurococcus sp. LOR1-02]MDO9709541.1 FlgO family outer membrane protein [Paracraurococcus sp. LOR1-02]